MAYRRIAKELRDLERDPLPSFMLGPVINDDYCHWVGTLRGPEGSPYEGGRFAMDIYLPDTYPFDNPRLFFRTKIFHPNVDNQGTIHHRILQNERNSALAMSNVILCISVLLEEPSSLYIVNPEAGQLYDTNKAAFCNIARKWTQSYAI